MKEVRNIFTDYNGTLDPKTLEFSLVYALMDYYKKQGNKERSRYLGKEQFGLYLTFFIKGSDAALYRFVDKVITGEEREAFEEAMKKVSSNSRDYIPAWVETLGRFSSTVEKGVFGEIDGEAIELFEKAKDKGLTTGIFSRSSTDIINRYLEANG
jgi:hypothetical protein